MIHAYPPERIQGNRLPDDRVAGDPKVGNDEQRRGDRQRAQTRSSPEGVANITEAPGRAPSCPGTR